MAQDDYLSRISTAPGGIGTLQLGPQAYIDPRDQRYVHDAYQYFLNQQGGGTGGGQDAATMPPITPSATPATTGNGGITAASAAQNMGGAGGAQNPLTQMITTPTGETMTVKQAMTQDDAYSLASDPFLASGAAGGARLPTTSDPFLVSGAAGGARLSDEQQDPNFLEKARDNFIATGQDIGNTFKDLVGQGIDISKMAGATIANLIGKAATGVPLLGTAINMLPEDTSEDTFNRQFAIEGEGFQDIATSDPDLGARLQGYSSDLSAGQNISGKDPFGRNTVSAFGNYEKALAEDLQYRGDNQFNKDKQAYAQAYFDKKGIGLNPNEAKAFEEKYGISPTGAPVTRDRLIDEGIAAADEEDDMFEPTIIPKEKPVTGVIKPGTLADPNWNKFKAEYITDDVSDAELYGDFDKGTTGAIPPGEKGGPGYIEPPGTLATDKWNTGAFDYGYDDSDDYGTYEPPASFSPPTNTDRPGGDRDSPAPSPTSTPSGPTYGPHGGGGADRDPAPSRSAPSAPTGISGPPGRGGSSGGPPSQGGGSPSSCFLKGTPITMADGTIKPVEQVDLGDEVAVGGKVFAVGKFLNNDLHDYKGVKVSGSHTVNEDGKWVRVEDSKHGKALGDDEHTVYVFGAENRRILINNILFTDYFEVNEQEKLMENEEDYFKNWKSYIKKDDINKINVLNAS